VATGGHAGHQQVEHAGRLIGRTAGQKDAEQAIAWVPFFPLGSAFPGFPKVADNAVVREIADELDATPAQVGLAWLLAHAPNTLLIPGTRSLGHLEENVGAGEIVLSADAMARLDAVSPPAQSPQYQHGLEPFQQAPTT
jgi:diketogulonate reductase-like aldo/keto reductase